MSECTHNCSTCGESCGERTSPQSFLKKPHADAHIGKVFGVVSGKGGVGKSMVTSQLAVSLHRARGPLTAPAKNGTDVSRETTFPFSLL